MTAKYRQLLMVLLMFPILLNGQNQESNSIILGAERMGAYLAFLHEKSVAIVANQTSVINNTHLVDTLLKRGVAIEKVFAPEHGFRGKKDAGESLKDGIDSRTKLPIVSLYGKNKKPSESMLQGIDIVIFDLLTIKTPVGSSHLDIPPQSHILILEKRYSELKKIIIINIYS